MVDREVPLKEITEEDMRPFKMMVQRKELDKRRATEKMKQAFVDLFDACEDADEEVFGLLLAELLSDLKTERGFGRERTLIEYIEYLEEDK